MNNKLQRRKCHLSIKWVWLIYCCWHCHALHPSPTLKGIQAMLRTLELIVSLKCQNLLWLYINKNYMKRYSLQMWAILLCRSYETFGSKKQKGWKQTFHKLSKTKWYITGPTPFKLADGGITSPLDILRYTRAYLGSCVTSDMSMA